MNAHSSPAPPLRLLGTVLLALTLSACGSDDSTPPVTTGAGDIEGRLVAQGGGALPAGIVSWEGETRERRSRLTNEEGLFLFREADAGEGLLWIAPPPGFVLAAGQANPVRVVVSDGGLTEVEILIAARDDVDSSNVGFIEAHAEDELLPANGIYVEATGSSPGDTYGATTAGEGMAVLGVPQDSYTLSAIVPSWYRLVDITPASVAVTLGNTEPVAIRVARIGPLPDGSIEVFVANPDSVPDNFPVPPGVPITVTRTDGPEFIVHGETDSLGRAHFDVAPGAYQVLIEVPDGFIPWPEYPNPAEVGVTSATSSWARFYLRPVIR